MTAALLQREAAASDPRAGLQNGLGPVLRDGWSCPGPKNLEYLMSEKPIVLAMGPVGCAKTSTAYFKGMVNTKRQPVRYSTGRKECKITVVCDTYKTVHNKALDSFRDLIPPDAPGVEYKGGKGEDVTVTYLWGDKKCQYKTVWHFVAVGDKSIEAMIAGLRTTCVHLYEPDHLPEKVVDGFAQRLGRWPNIKDLPDEGRGMFTQLWGDFNAPNDTNELYRRLALKTNLNTDHFIEFPSGFSPDAENLKNLPKPEGGYYKYLASTMRDPLEIKRKIENLVGYSRSGKPVYGDYVDDLHTASRLMTGDGTLPLIIGVDGGGSAAAVVLEPTLSGNLNVLDEIVTEAGDFTDAASFGERVAALLAMKYPGRAAIAVIDPAASNRSGGRESNGDMTRWIMTFQTHAKIKVLPGYSNNLDPRIKAVRRLLNELNVGVPRLQINNHCMTVREGFQSGYKIKEYKGADGTRYGEKPDKGHFSHVHDALQYGCMFFIHSPERLHDAVRMASKSHFGSHSNSAPKILL